jgi:hypothetical protein
MPYWTLSPIYFDPTGTLLSRSSIPSSQQISAREEIMKIMNTTTELEEVEEHRGDSNGSSNCA